MKTKFAIGGSNLSVLGPKEFLAFVENCVNDGKIHRIRVARVSSLHEIVIDKKAFGSTRILFYEKMFIFESSNLALKSAILYDNVRNIRIISDDDKKISNTIVGGIFAGGLGAVAENFKKSSKYYIQLEYKNNFRESFRCMNYEVADSVYNSIKSNLNINQLKETKDNIELENSSLKKKLIEIKKLKDEGLLTEEEYNLKRQQIIENH